MQTFESFFARRVHQGPLSELYRAECHVCAHTVRIFESLEKNGISLDRLAQIMAVDEANLADLKAGDCCDPRLVIRLCRHLELPAPLECPRLTDDR